MFDWATRECLPDPLTGESKPILEANPCEGVKRVPVPKGDDPDEESGHPTFTDEDLDLPALIAKHKAAARAFA